MLASSTAYCELKETRLSSLESRISRVLQILGLSHEGPWRDKKRYSMIATNEGYWKDECLKDKLMPARTA